MDKNTADAIRAAITEYGLNDDDTTNIMKNATVIYRKSAGEELATVLHDYYARKERGERVKLKALADAAGVNYGSLRQAKFRYEETRRQEYTKALQSFDGVVGLLGEALAHHNRIVSEMLMSEEPQDAPRTAPI
jgi:hypothetical protein